MVHILFQYKKNSIHTVKASLEPPRTSAAQQQVMYLLWAERQSVVYLPLPSRHHTFKHSC
uniref:Uncharacterized protein n=1 Tax=Anguilla anguilla TaxID=7936 RepID=A0A0E9W3Y0_ANGAN